MRLFPTSMNVSVMSVTRVMFVALLAAASSVHGQTASERIEASLSAIAAERESMNQANVSAAQRLEILERILLQRRERLIDAHPADPRLASWLADQAADLYFELLPTDAAGLTSLFGLPSPVQLQRACLVAGEMNELTARAEAAVERAIVDLESDPRYADDLELQQLRRGLDRDERKRRIPFLRGIAAFLHAELNVMDAGEDGRLYSTAATLLGPLGEELEDPLAGRARVHAGLALLRLGEHGSADSFFTQVATGEASHPSDVFAAHMGLARSQYRQGGAQAGLEALDSIEERYVAPEMIFYRVLIADQRFMLRREIAGSADPARRDALLIAAFDSYVDLLGDESGVDQRKMRAIVLAKLSLAADDDLPLEHLPPIVAMARARRLARQEGTQSEAVIVYEDLLGRGGMSDDDRIAVLEDLGRALTADGRPVEAVERFLELASEYPTSVRAEPAAELAARVAARHHLNSPGDPAARRVLDEVLSVVLDQYSNLSSINQWRYLAGRLAIDDGRWAEATSLFERVTPDAAQWLDAQFMRTSAVRAAARAETDPVAKIDRCETLLAIIERVRAALMNGVDQVADSQRKAALRYYLSYLRVFEAEALTVLNRTDGAIEVLAGIEEDAGLDPAVLAAALQARIDAHQRAGRVEQARRELERFTQAAPDEAAAVISPMLAAVQVEVEQLIDNGRDDRARSLAQRDLLPLAELLHQWLNEHRSISGAEADSLWRQAADGHRLGGRHETALRIYDRLLGRQPDALELLLGRAECLFALGGDGLGEAMGVYKRIAAAGTGDGPRQHRAYWQSQLRMLQILDLAQRNTHQIVPRIRRLRRQDASLGGTGFKRRFQRLENKYAGA